MNSKIEDTILWEKESDNYTQRAKNRFGDKMLFSDEDSLEIKKITNAIPKIVKQIKSILDIGCAYGGFSNALAEAFPNAEVIGIDPGIKSIEIAKKSFKKVKNLKFLKGYSHDIKLNKKFDLIILRMVLQWIPRSHLLKTIAEVDRLANKYIYVKEFSPKYPKTSVSVHNKKVRIFKQDYSSLFTSSPYYRLILREMENPNDPDNFLKSIYVIEKQSLEEAYLDQTQVQEKDLKKK